MVRVRVPGGVIPTDHARRAGRLAGQLRRRLVAPDDPPEPRAALGARPSPSRRCSTSSTPYGLSTRSACGHTMRNVMASEDAGVGLDEPFDCLPDARLISDTPRRPDRPSST